MSTELLDESPLYREWIEAAEARGYDRGYAHGFVRGFALGYAEGIIEGTRYAALRVLEIRFGAIDATLSQAINQAGNDTLDTLISHVAIDTLEQLRRLLGVQEP